jgi:hypothetical protein
VVLAVLAEDRAVGIHHHRGVVVDTGHVFFVDRQDHHDAELFRESREALHDGTVGGFGVAVVLLVFGDAEVRAVEQLLEADDLRPLLRRLTREAFVLVEHRLLVAGPGGLRNGCAHDVGHADPLSADEPGGCLLLLFAVNISLTFHSMSKA